LRCCELPSETTGSSLEEDGQAGELPSETTGSSLEAEARKPEATISLAQWMVGMNTSPRRIVTATLSSTAIALAANFLGVTSGLLSLFPEAAREQRLDIAYPVRGFKRHLDPQGRYTFIFPVRYVADQTVYMRNADAAYTRRTQDPLLAASGLRATPAAKSSGPDVAFGPPGTSAEENLSVVSGPLRPGSSLLGTLGPPEQAADKLLRERIAKQGEREVTLLQASERRSAVSGLPLYAFEYQVRGLAGNRFEAHFVCVVGAVRDMLFTPQEPTGPGTSASPSPNPPCPGAQYAIHAQCARA
jgi:hypothetical protein